MAAPGAARHSEVVTDKLSFIVRLWRDADPADPAPAPWRGDVTSVSDGERVYASGADQLPAALASQMARHGVRLGWLWRLRIALSGWRHKWRRRQ